MTTWLVPAAMAAAINSAADPPAAAALTNTAVVPASALGKASGFAESPWTSSTPAGRLAFADMDAEDQAADPRVPDIDLVADPGRHW